MTSTAVGWGRPYLRLALIIASLAALLFSLTVATRPALAQGPPGNNGTVKIHDGSGADGEPSPVMRNEPHVGCVFHIHGFNFDGGQSGDWKILEWPPTGNGELAASGDYSANSNGEFEEDVDLTAYVAAHPSGHNQGNHFKLFVEGENGTANDGTFETTEVKHKVFWVECPGQQGGPPPGQPGGEEEEEEEQPPPPGQPGGEQDVQPGQGGPGADQVPDTATGEPASPVLPALVVLGLLATMASHRLMQKRRA